MLVAIFSDTHNNLFNLDRALDVLLKQYPEIENLIHCGDMASPETLLRLHHRFKGNIFLALGNMDKDFGLEKFILKHPIEGLKLFKDLGFIELGGRKIFFIHRKEDLSAGRQLADKGADIIFYGHTHRPWEENYHGIRLVNPGNLEGTFFRPTFAVYDTVSREVRLMDLDFFKKS
ncbi:MAG: metallophosphoesterase family protein [Patescibacteria group bacterium]